MKNLQLNNSPQTLDDDSKNLREQYIKENNLANKDWLVEWEERVEIGSVEFHIDDYHKWLEKKLIEKE